MARAKKLKNITPPEEPQAKVEHPEPPEETPTEVVSETPTRLKQAEIPGTERPSIAAIDEAADEFFELSLSLKELKEKEKGSKERLASLMHQHENTINRDLEGNLHYRYGDRKVVLKHSKEKLIVEEVEVGEVNITVGAPNDSSEGAI